MCKNMWKHRKEIQRRVVKRRKFAKIATFVHTTNKGNIKHGVYGSITQ